MIDLPPKTIGGSDVGAILGLSPFRTRLDVWRGLVLDERDQSESPAMALGTRFEHSLLAAYKATLPKGSELHRPPMVVRGWRRASVDSVAVVDRWRRIVEAKTTSHGDDWGATGTDQVPLHYQAQCLWYMDLMEIDETDVPVLVWPEPYKAKELLGLAPEEIVQKVGIKVLRVEYSRQLVDKLRAEVDAFWRDHVEAEVPPAPVDLADAKRMWWAATGKAIEAEPRLLELLREHDAIKQAAEEIEARKETAEFELRRLIGDAETVTRDGVPIVSLKTTTRSAYTVQVAETKFRSLRTLKAWKTAQ
jgi:putative phage-type endonuclease